jgi:hypothetical protein
MIWKMNKEPCLAARVDKKNQKLKTFVKNHEGVNSKHRYQSSFIFFLLPAFHIFFQEKRLNQLDPMLNNPRRS